MWKVEGTITDWDGNFISSSNMYLKKGTSGGILYYKENNEYYGIGLVSNGRDDENGEPINVKFTFLTKMRLEQIQKWILESKRIRDLGFDFSGLYGNIRQASVAQMQYHAFTEKSDIKKPTSKHGEKFANYIKKEKFQGNTIVEELAKYHTPWMNHLNLSNNNMNSTSLKILSEADNSDLEILDVSKNYIVWNMPVEKGIFKYCLNWLMSFLIQVPDPDKNTLLEWNPNGLEAFSKANLTKLKKLNLAWTHLQEGGVKIIKDASWARQLTELNLEGNNLGNLGVITLSSGNFPKLNTLILSRNLVGNDGIAALAKTTWPLKKIDLTENDFEIELLKDARWEQLEVLNLSCNWIDQESMLALANFPYLKHISTIILDNCGLITQNQINAITQIKWPLKNLSLSGNKEDSSISVGWMEELIKGEWPLETLILERNHLLDQDIKVLAKAKWTDLKTLNLKRNFGHEGEEPLGAAESNEIQQSNVAANNNLTETIAQIKATFANLKELNH